MKMIKAVSSLIAFCIVSSFGVSLNAASVEKEDIPVRSYEDTVLTDASYDASSGVGGFVARLYKIALGRNYDQKGFIDWCDKLASGSIDGANCARGFFFSEEFLKKKYDVDTYLTILYRVFFDREPDQGGFNIWKDQIVNKGISYEEILEGFINSTEWANTCLRFGIVSGGTAKPTINVPVSTGIKTFVTSLYLDVLGRNPDQNGFDNWCNNLSSLKITGKDAARGFFYSPEFAKLFASKSDADIIRLFYKVFLNRVPAASEVDYWAGRLKENRSIDTLFYGFADSTEFRNKCLTYGIIPASVSADPIKPSKMTFIISYSDGSRKLVQGTFDYSVEQQTCGLINNLRAGVGSPSLTIDEDLRAVARKRAMEIAINFSHDRPDGSGLKDLLKGISYRVAGENIASSSEYSGDTFFNAWRNSATHYGNMIKSSYGRIGVGVFTPDGSSEGYAVMILVG